MQLALTAAEAAMLERILKSYLGDLRMEISHTDRQAFRDSLKRDEELIKRLLGDLAEVVAN